MGGSTNVAPVIPVGSPVIPPQVLGGGPYQGYSPKQTVNTLKGSENVMIRGILRRSWNNAGAIGEINGKQRIVTPFRAVNGLGDFLARPHYACNVVNPVKSSYGNRSLYSVIGSIPNDCDATGVPGASCNPKFVSDCSDYITYKKQRAVSSTYNDLSYGGDQHNASYNALVSSMRGF